MLTKEDLLAISELMNPIREDIAGIKGDIVEMKGDIAGLKEDVAGLKEDVAGLKEDVAGLKEDVAGLKEDVAGLKEDVAGLKVDVVRLNNEVTGIKGEIVGIKERLDDNEAEIRRIGTLMENDTDRMVNLLEEGHESLRQIIMGQLTPKEQHEETRTRVFALEEVAKLHTAQIEELQKKTG